MNKALKPCPFCGSTNLVDHKNYIVCNFCGACGPELGAPVDWNIRQEDSLLKKLQSFGKIKIKLDPGAYLPEYAHEADAGLDIRSPRDAAIWPHDSTLIDTGVHIAIPPGTVGMLKSKSGLNVKHGLLNTGVIDSGYTGSIMVNLYNHTDHKYFVRKGDKISQLVIMPVVHAQLEQVDELEETERGNNGFGSTGK